MKTEPTRIQIPYRSSPIVPRKNPIRREPITTVINCVKMFKKVLIIKRREVVTWGALMMISDAENAVCT